MGGGGWTRACAADVCARARAPTRARPDATPPARVLLSPQLLLTGGVQSTCYDIESDVVLCTLMRGWQGEATKQFMLQQPEVEVVGWDQVKYYPGKDEL